MARVTNPPAFLDRLKTALVSGLKSGGIDADVDSEPVPTTKLHRIMVLAPKFKALRHTERQNLVWRIAEQALAPDEQLQISMILTLTPDEANGSS
ncbi:MAG TPA: hypothetical protein VNT79_11870 [Phycisphaerae bacterium]|nr:hypothetical protein [Phycisphaerae bacterium]